MKPYRVGNSKKIPYLRSDTFEYMSQTKKVLPPLIALAFDSESRFTWELSYNKTQEIMSLAWA